MGAYHQPIPVGTRFTKLVIASEQFIERRRGCYRCQCDCGKVVVVAGTKLKSRGVKSCGCLKRPPSHFIHGHATATFALRSTEYRSWAKMKERCYCQTHEAYKNYGGRGISVCDRWRDSFSNFLSDMGPKPTPRHSIDRINNDGNYEPGNCRWATQKEQLANRRPRVTAGAA